MYPIFPTVDLKKQHVYDLTQAATNGLQSDHYQHVHTIVHLNDDGWPIDTDLARLVMFSFGQALVQAKLLKSRNKLELNERQELKEPLVVNAVSMAHSHLSYVSFQLNTLNYESNEGVKNIVHYDTHNEIYLNRPTIDKLPYPTL